jgi:hypothetical protein
VPQGVVVFDNKACQLAAFVTNPLAAWAKGLESVATELTCVVVHGVVRRCDCGPDGHLQQRGAGLLVWVAANRVERAALVLPKDAPVMTAFFLEFETNIGIYLIPNI